MCFHVTFGLNPAENPVAETLLVTYLKKIFEESQLVFLSPPNTDTGDKDFVNKIIFKFPIPSNVTKPSR